VKKSSSNARHHGLFLACAVALSALTALLMPANAANAAPTAPDGPTVLNSLSTPNSQTAPGGLTAPNGTIRLHTGKLQKLPAKRPGATPSLVSGTFRELQLNLCNSGVAHCYTGGRSIDEAASLMYVLSNSATPPDLVTLNEVCYNDIASYLAYTMGDIWPADDIFFMFAAAIDGNSGAQQLPFQCTNGDAFGSAIIGHVPDSQYYGMDSLYGLYTAQNTEQEKRTFGCVYLVGHFYTCVTHLVNANESIAMNQCNALMSSAIPYFKSYEGVDLPTVAAGDLNLKHAGGAYDVQNCVPAGYYRKGDGDVMHVMATNNIAFQRTDSFGMSFTDHNAFFVTLTMP
jgi:hypothetical protein